jgi:2-polyprenyl-3-methyl-5-hydroxy-6-metoxy-1,4-benzoquinol methylase
MDCCGPDGTDYDRQFDARHAEQHLRDYRRDGPRGLTRALIDGLAADGLEGRTVLDIGGGVGAVHHELLRAGASTAVDVDASRAYLAAARGEAERQGHADRVQYIPGDFVAIAPTLDAVDLVALDRVVCCYPDMTALVGRSATLARHRYGLVYPRDTWLARAAVALLNARFRLSRSTFRSFVHPSSEVEAVLAGHGLVKRQEQTTLIWQLAIYERPAA